MSRRPPGNPSRRHGGDAGRVGALFALNSKARSSPCLPIAFIVAVLSRLKFLFLLLFFFFFGSLVILLHGMPTFQGIKLNSHMI
uniref:Uncharacterized protein n=1 Tax=Rhizophora mucronata TaxID=61149 RepID=A0A2P2KN74_RHIMU